MHARLLWLVVLLISAPALARDCLHYGLPDFLVEGRLSRGEATETSMNGQESAHKWYLETSEPFCLSAVVGSSDTPRDCVRRFEVWPTEGEAPLREHQDRLVVISGHFLPSEIPHYHEYLIFSASAIQAAPTPNNSFKGMPLRGTP